MPLPKQDQLKTVWISTAPRTGSMWLFNITRDILRQNGLTVLPEKTPQASEEMLQLAQQQAWLDDDPKRIWVLKIHGVLNKGLPHSKIITSQRDPRDMLISYSRFMRIPIEHALSNPHAMIEALEHYRQFPADQLFEASFNAIVATPHHVISDIARFLSLPLSEAQAQAIADDWGPHMVQRRINAIEREVQQKISRNEPVEREKVVVLAEDNIRAFDPASGFQSGHIAPDPSQNWRTLLTDAQKEICLEQFGDWIRANGYPER